MTGEAQTSPPRQFATDVDAAVRNARDAFERGPWPRMPARDRARIRHRAADLIRERAHDLVAVESCAALAQGIGGATRSTPIPRTCSP